MVKRFSVAAAALALGALLTVPAFAQSTMSSHMSGKKMSGHMSGSMMKDPMVGGKMMYPSKNIVQNAMASPDHTTLVSLVKKAGLVSTLEGPGPFTVFAPTNQAFDKIPKAMLDKVADNKALLKKVLLYHVVPGKLNAADIAAKIKAGHGKAMLKTAEGENLTASMENGKLTLTGAKGGEATVTVPNVYQSNGVIHVINAALMP